jgi:hypothetical protein
MTKHNDYRSIFMNTEKKDSLASRNEAGEVLETQDAAAGWAWAIEPRFDEVRDFAANGLAWFEVKDKWGYIDEKGEEVIAPRFDKARTFVTNGLARVNGYRLE